MPMLENPEISGLLYKRRGGFGKMMPNAWQFRFFSISKDGVLSYFDTEMPDTDIGEMKARGKLDLRSVNYEIVTDPIEGAPTPHAISIAAPNEEKWKVCSETKDDHVRWLKVLYKYQLPENKTFGKGIVSYTSDDDGDKPNRGLSRRNTVAVTPSSSSSNHQFQSHSAASTPTASGREVSRSEPSRPPVEKSGGKKRGIKIGSTVKSYSDNDQYEVFLVLGIVNICFLGVWRSSSLLSILFYFVIGNFVVAFTLKLRAARTVKAEISSSHPAPALPVPESSTGDKEGRGAVDARQTLTSAENVAAPVSSTVSADEIPMPVGKPIAGKNAHFERCMSNLMLCLAFSRLYASRS